METGNIKWAAIVMASLAMVVDAAVETWWVGSPIRWSVLAGAAVCAASMGVSWRRLTWPSRATLSALLLLGLVTATAWLPGGLRAGIRIAGLSTAAVFILVTTASILFGAVVAWRFAVLPRPIRVGLVLIAAYAVSACVLALKAGVPFTDLFNGGSLWQRLPSWLQGGVLGGMVVLPFALVIAIARAAIPRLRTDTVRSATSQVVALATSLALVVAALPVGAFWPSRDQAATAAAALPAPTPIVPSAALSETLENSLRAVEDGERESPRDRWDPTYVASTIGPDPAQLADWVAGNTFWIPYKGVLRGGSGVLMDRVGNSLDRALLLAQLLEAAGHHVRLAHGELPDQRAAELLPVLVAARPGGAARAAGSAPGRIDADDVRKVAAQ